MNSSITYTRARREPWYARSQESPTAQPANKHLTTLMAGLLDSGISARPTRLPSGMGDACWPLTVAGAAQASHRVSF
jgi:hypothetical protein